MQIIILFAAVLTAAFAQRTTDVCSQVQLMSQYCTSHGANGTGNVEVATMKVLEEKMNVRMRGSFCSAASNG